MLAKPGKAFDSDDHVFELKWDGMRTLAFVEGGAVQLINRQKNVVTERYPELHGLADLPDGTVLDGEIAFLDDTGRPVFERLLRREQVRGRRIAAAQARYPAVYAAFDQLYAGFESTMNDPLLDRRERLEEVVGALEHPRILFSDGVIGAGRAFFDQACERELEGIVAKRLDSRYLAGRRTDAWTKIKRAVTVYCAILGWIEDGEDDFKSLLIGTDVEGELNWVGRVGSGFGADVRKQLNELLRSRRADQPIVPVDDDGQWVEPGLYCTVTYLERTGRGMLRAPRFGELVVES